MSSRSGNKSCYNVYDRGVHIPKHNFNQTSTNPGVFMTPEALRPKDSTVASFVQLVIQDRVPRVPYIAFCDGA